MNDPRDVRQIGGEAYAPQAMPGQPQWPQAPAPSMRPAPASYGQPGPAMHPGHHQAAPAPAMAQEPQGSAPAAIAASQGLQVAPVPEGTVELSRAYQAHGEAVKLIRLRTPVTKEIRNIGNPVKIKLGADGTIDEFDIKWDRIAAYVVALAEPPLPPSTVDQFEFWDLDACAARIVPFFVR